MMLPRGYHCKQVVDPLVSMPLEIKHIGIAEPKHLIENEFATFERLEIFPFLCPNGVSASRQEKMCSEIKGVMVSDATAKYTRIIDTEERDRIVTFAKWHIPTAVKRKTTSPTRFCPPQTLMFLRPPR